MLRVSILCTESHVKNKFMQSYLLLYGLMAKSVSKEHYPTADLGDLKMKERQKALHVIQLFGHKSIRNTYMYTQLGRFQRRRRHH